MLTPQEVANKSFSKTMNGYNMHMVDEFLDELTEDYSTLFKENAALKAKLKVLVDKVEEYRATEDNMRSALFTAQKMAGDIVEDAKRRAATITLAAEEESRAEIARIRESVEGERRRLDEAKAEMAQFIAQWKDIVSRQAEFLISLPELPDAEGKTAPAVEPPAAGEDGIPTDKGIEDTIHSILKNTGAESVEEKTESAAAEELPGSEDMSELFGTRTFHLDELKFGRNYEADADK